MRARHSVNEGFGKELHRKDNSVKRSGHSVNRPTLKITKSLCLHDWTTRGLETESLLDFKGRAGITSIVRWNLRPVTFRVKLTGRILRDIGILSLRHPI